ncbi:hypothetical protein B0H19DRAFT_1111683 [Mycena capillaripes]|nr:hypothetical protein B0H19DRAFT_1201723 [Mycena capillaripes]KAJ6586176.1 hypothetical protein B0H19DRAFT_1111683 [Mycena capillaripes]
MIFVFIPLVLSLKSQAQHQKAEVSYPFALHLTSVLFSLQPKSKRLNAALRPQKADLEGYVRLAHITFV